MANNQPDPGEFLEMAQRMLRQLFGDQRSDDEPWAAATSSARERSGTSKGHLEPSSARQRENLTFALATRAVEALEDLALNVAAIRQRLERRDTQAAAAPTEAAPEEPGAGRTGPDGTGTTEE